MKKFIIIYYANQSARDSWKDLDPEESKKGMAAWKQWAEKCGNGLVDFGNPLGQATKVTKEGSSPNPNDMVGYSLIQAEEMNNAVELVKDHPHLSWVDGCSIEVLEAKPMSG